MGNVLEFRGVSKELGGKPVLRNVSFEVEEGKIFGVIGMSGSGKTTLLHHMIGYLRPNEGQIFYQHVRRDPKTKQLVTRMVDLSGHYAQVKQTFGYAPQKPSFYPQLTSRENLFHFGGLYGVPPAQLKKTIEVLLDLTQLSKHQHTLAGQLSGGQQRRLSIICSLVHQPEVLILDEPTADLDPILREEVWELITRINKQGKTVIIASHFLDELERMCDRVAIVHEGQVLKWGSLDQIKLSHPDKFEQVTITAPGSYHEEIVKTLQQNTSDLRELKYAANEIVFKTDNPYEVLVALALLMRKEKGKVIDVEIKRPGLSEIFAHLLK